MIKPIQSQERFEQNLKIEQKLSKIHGYNLQNSQYSPKSRSQQKKQGMFMINRNINPLDVKEKQLQKSERLKQLIKQIQQLEMQKQIDKMAERNNNQEVKIIDLLNTKIREYNYLVEHRHLMNKKSRSMFSNNKSGEQKRQDGYYIQRLKEKQSQLNKTSSLMSRINKNKQITNIYRDYSLSFKLKPNYKIMNTESKCKSKKQEMPNRTIKIKEMLQNVNNHMNSNKQSRYAQDIDFQYPYINKKYLEKIQTFHQDLRRNTKIKKIMKEKLFKVQSLNTSQIVRTAHDNKIDPNNLSQQLTHQSTFDQYYNNLGRKFSQKQIQEGMSDKEKYFIMGLKKISPKYVKAEDSKFVTRYKVQKVAKQMMEGPSPTKKKQIKLNIPKMYNRKLKVPDNLPEEEKTVMRYMIEEQDDAYYWTTCRNQKMNLLLKGKIHK